MAAQASVSALWKQKHTDLYTLVHRASSRTASATQGNPVNTFGGTQFDAKEIVGFITVRFKMKVHAGNINLILSKHITFTWFMT